MTATIDISPEGAHDQHVPQPEATGGYGLPGQPAAGRAMIAIELLTAHPANVRRDIHLDQEFLDSITELGILTPLRITPAGISVCRVIEGHRRLAAAEKLGLTEVPYDLAAEREGDEAGQFLDMYATNHHRKGLSTLEEADALFGASVNGASKRRIRKATGLGPDEVASALKAAGMSGLARETAAAFGQTSRRRPHPGMSVSRPQRRLGTASTGAKLGAAILAICAVVVAALGKRQSHGRLSAGSAWLERPATRSLEAHAGR